MIACSQMPDGRGAPSQNFEQPQRNFGQEIYRLLLKEAALHPLHSDQRVNGVRLLHQDWNVPDTINTMVPDTALSDVEGFLRNLLPLYDDNTLSQLTQEIAILLKKAATDKDLLGALVLMNKRVEMNPPSTPGDSGLLGRILHFPKNRQLLETVVDWLLLRDGVNNDGNTPQPSESDLLRRVLDKMASSLKESTAQQTGNDPSLLLDILLTEDERLDLKTGKRCAVLFDASGQPVFSASGKKSTQPVPPPFPRNIKRVGNCQEVLADDGNPAYDIRDLSKTILGSLVWDMRTLILEDLPLKDNKLPFPFNMTKGIRPILGEKDNKGNYTKQSPMLQMVRAAFAVMKGPKLYKVIRMLARIAEKEEPQLASLLSLLDELSQISDRHPSANLTPGHSLMDDILPYLQEILAEKGMMEDILRALQTPGLTAKIKKSSVLLLKFAKQTISVDTYIDHKNGKTNLFSKAVDHSQADLRGNISLFQRILHLMADVHRHNYNSRIKALGGIEIPFLEMRIKGLALLYLRSVEGNLSIWETIYVNGEPIKDGILKDQLKNSLPIMGLSENPNPEELGIFINRELKFKQVPLLGPIKVDLTLDPIIGREGYEVRFHHGDSLLGGLASGLIGADGGALRPIAKVFAKYNKLERVLDLLGVLHRHWASSGNVETDVNGKTVYPTPRTNMRSLEPMLVEILDTTNFLEQLESTGKIMLNTKLSDAANAEMGMPALIDFLAFLMGKPNTPLKQTPMGTLTDSFDAVDKSLEGATNKDAREAWSQATTSLSNLLMKVEGKGTQARFANRRVPVVLTRLLYRAAAEIEDRDLQGRWVTKINEMTTDMEDMLTDPIMPVLLDLLDDLVKDKQLLTLTTDLIVHMLPDPAKEPAQFGEMLSLIAAFLSPTPDDIRVPVNRFLGRTLDEHRPLLTRVLAFVKRTFPLDPKDQLINLLQRSIIKHPKRDESILSFMPAMVKTFYRRLPGSSLTLDASDYQTILQELAHYLTNKEQGMEKLYQIVKNRNGTSPPTTSNQP